MQTSNTGRSLTDEDKLPNARSLMRKAGQGGGELRLPLDVVAAAGVRANDGRIVQAAQVPDEAAGLQLFLDRGDDGGPVVLAIPYQVVGTMPDGTPRTQELGALSRRRQ